MKKSLCILLAALVLCASALGEGVVTATDGSTKIRSGPGLDYEELDILSQGCSAEYTGQTQEDDRPVAWYSISYEGIEGWVSSRYTTLDTQASLADVEAAKEAEAEAEAADEESEVPAPAEGGELSAYLGAALSKTAEGFGYPVGVLCEPNADGRYGAFGPGLMFLSEERGGAIDEITLTTAESGCTLFGLQTGMPGDEAAARVLTLPGGSVEGDTASARPGETAYLTVRFEGGAVCGIGLTD